MILRTLGFNPSPIQLNPQNLEINTGAGVNNLRLPILTYLLTQNTKVSFQPFFRDYELSRDDGLIVSHKISKPWA